MRRFAPFPALLLAAGLLAVPTAAAADGPRWPQFRGPGATGVVEGVTLPTTWDVATGRGVLWSTPIPGLGHSSPAVWDAAVFVTSAVSGTQGDPEMKVGLYGDIKPVDDDSVHRFLLLRLDRTTGKVVWSRTVAEAKPKVKRHTKSTHANPSPATDGTHVVAFFGSEGLHAFAMDGTPLWSKDLGLLDSGYFEVPEAQWGFAASPVIHDGTVYVQCDVQGQSFVAAFDVATGKERWRTDRDEVPTWGSPTVHVEGDSGQLLVNGWRHIGGYDLKTGAERWRMRGGGDIPAPTPFVADGLIFITNAHGGTSPIWAVRTSARGDVTPADDATSNEHVAWSAPRGGSYIPTSIVYGDLLYVVRDNGVLDVYRAATGERLSQNRLGDGAVSFTSSPVAGDGKLYAAAEGGEVFVIGAGAEPEVLAVNDMGAIVMGSPAIAGDTLLIRTANHLTALGAGRSSER